MEKILSNKRVGFYRGITITKFETHVKQKEALKIHTVAALKSHFGKGKLFGGDFRWGG
jgi:hypothetical protein